MLGQFLLGAVSTVPTSIPSNLELPTPWSEITGETILQVLLLILPGLLSVAIINALTVRQKLEPLERIIQALLYTFVNHVTWQVFLLILDAVFFICTFGHWSWTPTPMGHLIGLGACALIWGLAMTWIINGDWVHAKLRDCGWVGRVLERLHLRWLAPMLPKEICWGITKRSSRPNEWYEAFYDATDYYVVIHLKDQRRIYGWANLYPDLPTEGHILMRDAVWLEDSADADLPPRPLMNILVDVTDVRFVEFLPAIQEVESVR